MQAVTENENINKILAQIRTAIKGNKIRHENNTKWILEKISNINFQVIANNYLQLKHPDLIGCTALHFAVEEEKPEAFDILLSYGADFTLKNSNNATVLHRVVEKHVTKISKAYTINNTFVNSVLAAHQTYNNFQNPLNNNELSHFHVACATNNVEVVKGFLQSGVFIDHAVKMDSPNFPGFTSLHFAAKYSAFEVAHLLLSHSANLHIKDATGMTPLHVALERKLKIVSDIDADGILKNRNDQILKLLLNKESSNGMLTIDDWGLSNLHASCTLKDCKLAESILPKVTNINHTVSMNSPFWPGYTALHFAALCNIDSVRLLIKQRADIYKKNTAGISPFDICLERYNGKEILLMLSANVLIFLQNFNADNAHGSSLWPGSPMHLAVLLAKNNNQSDQVDLQLLRNLYQQNFIMIYIQDLQGRTPLHLAFRLNKKSVIDLLLEFLNERPNNLIDCIDQDGLSLLHIVTAKNETSLIEKLLSNGANVNNVYKGKSQFLPMIYSGSTALHIAVVNGTPEIVDILVRQGADLYAKDINDMTPIHYTFLSTKKKMTKILLSSSNLRDSTVNGLGLSHLHVASRCKKSKAVEILLDKGADINGRITRHQQNVNVDSSVSSLLESYVGYSPLIVAYKRQITTANTATLKLLLERGADIFVEYENGVALFYHLLETGDPCMDDFLEIVKNSETLMARVNAETGMTSFHLACFDLDIHLIKEFLDDGANVNAQIPTESPILQGYTPLHILAHVSGQYNTTDRIEKIINVLLQAGADVTLPNKKLETPVHIVYNSLCEDDDQVNKNCHLLMNMLLKAQRDFSVNPTSINGISHFQIACYICNVEIVEKFLNNADIDINQPIDYFNDEKAGYSALHFAASSNKDFCRFVMQLHTVGLLLNHGADVHAQDFFGNTPFHECARYNFIDLFERLVRTGGDVNSRNICGDTPLYHYLISDYVSYEGIKMLIRFGCRLNTYNAVTQLGYMGEILNLSFPHEHIQNLFFILVENFKYELRMDDFRRTAIHNIVSIEPPLISANVYVDLIEHLLRVDCDIDDQDNLGRTALHVAVKFRNFKAISGLLLAGADVNRIDIDGKTALDFDVYSCNQCKDEYQETNDSKCHNLQTVETLAIHVKKLQLCGLDVTKQNEEFAFDAFERLKNDSTWTEQFFQELETIKTLKFGSHSPTVYDLLSEYGVVVSYPRMLEVKRNEISELFSSDNKIQKVREKFPEIAELLLLQFRKAKARSKLMELAKDALTIFSGYRLPEICSEYVLTLLKNSELENLITSAIATEVEIVNKF